MRKWIIETKNNYIESAVKTFFGTPMESGTEKTHKHNQDCDLSEVISLLGETRLAKSLKGGNGDSDWLVDMIKGYNGKMVEGAKEMKRLIKKSNNLKIKVKGGKVKMDKLEKDKEKNDSQVKNLKKILPYRQEN